MTSREQMQAQLAEALQDKYEVVKWIGGGGMAQVYLARHRIHGALFAVKVLSLDLAQDERIVARFVQEARTAATLAGHPNIVPIFDIGAANGLYYLIMQYVEGSDLSSYLKVRKKLSPADASAIIRQVADALVWACAKNIIHRDLKPSNLYMTRDGRVVVLDFGIAKAADVPGTLTLSTERLGTPYYMSPEQIRGEHCDSRSDLYSLGIVFFELLAGSRPFDGSSYREIELAHVQKPPPDLRELDGSISQELCAIVSKLLRKEPGERYQTAKQLIEDLAQYGAGSTAKPVSVSDAPTEPLRKAVTDSADKGEPRNGRRVSTSGLLIAGIAVAAVALMAGGFLLWKQRAVTNAGTGPAPAMRTAEVTKAPPKVKLDRLGGRMLVVAAGDFIRGSDDPESPVGKQTASLPAFYIDEAAVSNANYHRFCEESGRQTPKADDYAAHPDLPVTEVSFDDAQAYASWIGNRLPNEAEWEKAARGTDGRTYAWGNEPWQDAPSAIHSVLSYPNRASPYGIYNMAGNVSEWTTDHFQINQQFISDMTRVLRSANFSHDWKIIKGGAVNSPANFLKTYMRRGFPRDIGSPYIGFRCVTNLQ